MPEWKIPLYKIYTDDEDLNLITKIIKTYPSQTTYSKEVYNWDISNYNLFPGDQIQFRVAIKDNNPNNNGIRKTDYYHAVYPSFEDIFSAIQEQEQNIQETSSDIIDQVNEVEDIVENMKLDLLKASEIDWEQQQQAEESIKKMEDIFSNIEEMQEAINQLQEEAEKGNYNNIKELQSIFSNPYKEQSSDKDQKYNRLKPSKYFNYGGVSHYSCSS